MCGCGFITLELFKIKNGSHKITKVMNMIFSLNHNEYNKTRATFIRYVTSLSCKIQNDRHEITKVSISSSIIEIKT